MLASGCSGAHTSLWSWKVSGYRGVRQGKFAVWSPPVSWHLTGLVLARNSVGMSRKRSATETKRIRLLGTCLHLPIERCSNFLLIFSSSYCIKTQLMVPEWVKPPVQCWESLILQPWRLCSLGPWTKGHLGIVLVSSVIGLLQHSTKLTSSFIMLNSMTNIQVSLRIVYTKVRNY